ncbi:MFS transporter [Amycolatopsis sp.]|uniref:MFS transporter n=1 Tax=Amycolatopsis sp. TaxID=37632 RepID=UPI002E07320C|nr:MFS transporter [Amycolatopsis sp.]
MTEKLFTHRAYWRWSTGVQLARLPAAMAPLAFTVLTTATTGSYRLGGIMMSVYVVAELVCAVPSGRLLDRVGPAKGLVLLLVCAAAGLGGLAAAASAGASGATLLALVVVPGAISGGLSGGFRTLLAGTISDELLPRAIAVDAMILDGVLILGPALVAVLTMADSLLPLVAMAVVYLLSATLVPQPSVSRETPSANRPMRTALPWLACQFTIGHLLSTVEVAPLPLAQRLGAGERAAALVIAVLCGASIAGSALYAWRGLKLGRPRLQAGLLLGGFVVGGSLVAGNFGWPGLLAGIVVIGSCTGPLVTVASVQMQRLLPKERRSEGFSLSFAVQSTGFGIGSLSVGVLPLSLAPLLGVASALVACLMLGKRPKATVGTLSATS